MSWRHAPRHPERVAAGTPLLALGDVRADLGGRPVVRGVDLQVRAGELVALVGPNGAGKSTILRVASGDLAATGGRVLVAGAATDGWSTVELAMRRAVLPQQSTVSFPFTVREVVAMGRAPWHAVASAAENDAAIDRAVAEAGIAHLLTRTFGALSGGEQARAALARVLAQQAQLLLLDEPTAALDVAHQEHVLGAVRRRVADGDGALLVVHDLELAGAYADRVVVVDEGLVAADGPPGEVLRADLLSRVYRHRLEVLEHPRTGAPLVLPVRAHADCPALTADGRPDPATAVPPVQPLTTNQEYLDAN